MLGSTRAQARRTRWLRVSWVVLVVGFTLSGSISWAWYRGAELQARHSFQTAAAGIADALTSSLRRIEDTTTAVAGLARTMPGLTNRTFQEWYRAVDQDSPGTSAAIGFIRYVPASRLPTYLADRRGDIGLDGTVVESAPPIVPPGDRAAVCIADLGVWNIGELAFPPGLDYCALQPSLLVDAANRRTSVSPAAGAETLAALSRMLGAPITAVPDALKDTFFYSTPVFDGAAGEGRQAGLLGWVGGFFSSRDLLAAPQDGRAHLNVTVAHLNQTGESQTVVTTGNDRAAPYRKRFGTGRNGKWVVDISGSGTQGGPSPSAQALIVGGIAAAASVLLFFLFRVLASAQSNAASLVERQTRELRAANDDRAHLLKGTLEVAEREQARLAVELHDGPIQQLTASCFAVDRTLRRLRRGDVTTATTLLEQVRTDLTGDTAALRTMMVELRPPLLDEAGLGPALRAYAEAFAARTGIEVAFTDELGGIELFTTVEVALYRTAQQALVNIDRHASATNVSVTLHLVGGAIELVVRDDGRGFDPTTAPALLRDGHYGLAGMRERIELAGGTWRIESRPGEGTTVTARIAIGVGQSERILQETAP